MYQLPAHAHVIYPLFVFEKAADRFEQIVAQSFNVDLCFLKKPMTDLKQKPRRRSYRNEIHTAQAWTPDFSFYETSNHN